MIYAYMYEQRKEPNFRLKNESWVLFFFLCGIGKYKKSIQANRHQSSNMRI